MNRAFIVIDRLININLSTVRDITLTIFVMVIWVWWWKTIRITRTAVLLLYRWLILCKRAVYFTDSFIDPEDSDNGRIYHQQIQLRLQFFPDPAAAEKAIALVSGVAPQY
ncbi:hypothetical protein ES332_D07G220900v1 [Gossypium tomentosum]|uniref:Uncharacterized protein n=1 Tax=Gossypium tomentosum TaxID=34277 RepID=A0A5D2KA36_GOSTO|nr:hypothetical protein ES332_D07G220900v1 [Gossypium tomentosum]